ncbi:MAG: filamentous hemagglutinin N-terminal domain-containing protein, partial [Coleofasciculus sp. C1-SOL-03]|uniref:beta strand repeat-containing protein n=1 Tax=Coleofasciculus sp. C1-SOL-03 TaxID=3069522 RepID=UPI0032F32433
MNRVHLLTAAVTGFWLWVFNLGTSSEVLVLAQPITPADGTGTIVTPDGNRIDISGGSLSGDGKNLFHSFQQFGLDANQIANFLANPNLNNILSSVVGGDASVINGLIQVTGGNPNLYLMNPAGIIFGPSSQLNVPGDFIATTADAIGFGDDNWFNAIGGNDYQNLVGTPNQFAFDGTEAGSIVNAGDLAVSEGKNLTLLAGNVVNTGKLTAPGGSITVAAVPGSNLVKISRPGGLLSLEVEPPRTPDGEVLPVQPGDLAELLTGSGEEVDTGVEVNESGDVQLADTGVTLPKETGVAIVSGEINVSNVGTPSPSSSTGGEINVIGNKVGLIAANVDASGSHGGGTIRIGGGEKGLEAIPNADVTFISEDSRINADALDEGSGGRTIAWSDQTTRTYGHISARGGENGGNGGFVETSSAGFLDVPFAPDITAPAGDGGTWLIDPFDITISTADNTIGNISGTAPDFKFTAAANGSVLNINTLLAGLSMGNVTVDTGAGGMPDDGNITLATNLDFNTRGVKTLTLIAAKNIVINGRIFDSDTTATPGDGLSLVFDAGGAVELNQSISTGGFDLTITANGAITQTAGTLNIGGRTRLAAGAGNNITLNNNGNNFNEVLVTSANNVSLRDDINDNNIAIKLGSTATTPPAFNISGTLNITANGDITDLNNLTVGGGTVLNATGNDITLDNANKFSTVAVTSGANVILNDNNGIDLGASSITGTFGVTAGGNITDSGNVNVTGDTTLNANGNDITLNNANDFSTVVANGRNVSLNDSNGIDLGASSITGTLGVTARGAITDSGNLSVTGGTTTLNANGNDITLNNGNNFSTVAVTSGANVTLKDSNTINLGASTITGNLGVTATDVNINGTVSAANATFQPSSDTSTIGIGDSATGTFNLNATDLSNLKSTGTVTIGSDTVTGKVTINDVDLSGENFNLIVKGGNPTFTGILNLPNNLNVTATTGNISQNSGTVTVNGQTTLATGTSNDITFGNTTNNFNTVAVTRSRNVTLNDSNGIKLGASNITGTLDVTAGGNITDSGDLSVTGDTTLDANDNDIILDSANNNFSTIAVEGKDVTLNDEDGINLGASKITGNLGVTATNVNINDTVEAANATFQPTDSTSTIGIGDGATGDFNLNTTDLSNLQSNGTVTIGNGTVTGDVTINDVDLSGETFNLTVQGGNPTFTNTINLPNNLNVTATTGNITQNSGTVTVNGQATLATGTSNDITFANTTNNFNTVAVSSGRNVTLNDSNEIDLGASTITGTLDVTATGEITDSSNLSVTGETTLNANGNDITLNNANNFSTVAANGANVTLNDNNGIDLGASNITGTLDVTAEGNITDSG